ncbi:hypothetical protein G6F56_013003 [Rhizopus delemar]|nr:hypothetical protein G6F56_013003 [Rhizopus delemar]
MDRKPVNTDRDVEALESRWRSIIRKTMEFCGKLAKVIALKTSGANEKDNRIKAEKLWADDNDSKKFALMYCYDILQNMINGKRR